MKALVTIAAALLALAACGRSGEELDVLPAPAVRLAAIPGRPAAGYLALLIHGDRGALVSVTSPQAARIEMHETMSAATMTSMRPLARIPVHDGDTLTFSPGGQHLMLFGLAPSVRPGPRIALILHFERGQAERLTAAVEAAGGPA